jgi:hypothetical protein
MHQCVSHCTHDIETPLLWHARFKQPSHDKRHRLLFNNLREILQEPVQPRGSKVEASHMTDGVNRSHSRLDACGLQMEV